MCLHTPKKRSIRLLTPTQQNLASTLGVFFGQLTQLVEWLAVNQYVAGSNPALSAKFTSSVLTDWAFLLPQKQGGGDYENERCWDAIIYLVGV